MIVFNYYPFGMMMPARKYSATDSYRYGFNGKENDNDVKGEGNQQDYGMRIYDPRLGRFLSVDPLMRDYPWNSTYAFAEADPINFIDLDGLEQPSNTAQSSGTQATPTTIKIDASNVITQKVYPNKMMCHGATQKPWEGIEDKYTSWGDFLTQNPLGKAAITIDEFTDYIPNPKTLVKKSAKVIITKIVKKSAKAYVEHEIGVPIGLSSKEITDIKNYISNLPKAFEKLTNAAIETALKSTSRLQHAFKHTPGIKKFANKNWNKTVEKEWREFNEDVLKNATATFENELGGVKVKGYYKKVDGQDIGVQIFAEGDKAGQLATTVVLSENQMKKFNLKK